MYILLPIFNQPTSNKYKKNNLENFLNQIKALYKTVAITNDPACYQLLLNYPIEKFYLSKAISEQNLLLPGALESLQLLLNKKLIKEHEQVLVLDYRNPFIDKSLIDSFFDQGIKGQAKLSLYAPRDHPVQLYSYYEIVYTDLLLKLDPDFFLDQKTKAKLALVYKGIDRSPACLFCTYPFFLHLDRYFLPTFTQGQVALKTCKPEILHYPQIIPLKDLDQELKKDLFIHSAFYVQSKNTARRLLPSSTSCFPSEPEYKIKGISFYHQDKKIPCALFQSRDCLELFLDPDLLGSCLKLYLFPLQESQNIDYKKALQIEITPEEQKGFRQIGLNQKSLAGPFCCLENDSSLGYFLMLLRPSSDHSFDFAEPLAFKECPWDIDPQTLQKYNPQNQTIISGRQTFPTLYEVEGSLAQLNLSQAENLDLLIKQGQVFGLFLPEEKSCKIEDQIDYFKYLAMIENEA